MQPQSKATFTGEQITPLLDAGQYNEAVQLAECTFRHVQVANNTP